MPSRLDLKSNLEQVECNSSYSPQFQNYMLQQEGSPRQAPPKREDNQQSKEASVGQFGTYCTQDLKPTTEGNFNKGKQDAYIEPFNFDKVAKNNETSLWGGITESAVSEAFRCREMYLKYPAFGSFNGFGMINGEQAIVEVSGSLHTHLCMEWLCLMAC